MQSEKKLKTFILLVVMSLNYAMISMADVHITDQKFKDMSLSGVPGMIIGGVLFVLKIAGFLLTMAGAYKMASARKAGEAEEMNVAIIKLVIGLCFLCFETILKALGILAA